MRSRLTGWGIHCDIADPKLIELANVNLAGLIVVASVMALIVGQVFQALMAQHASSRIDPRFWGAK